MNYIKQLKDASNCLWFFNVLKTIRPIGLIPNVNPNFFTVFYVS